MSEPKRCSECNGMRQINLGPYRYKVCPRCHGTGVEPQYTDSSEAYQEAADKLDNAIDYVKRRTEEIFPVDPAQGELDSLLRDLSRKMRADVKTDADMDYLLKSHWNALFATLISRQVKAELEAVEAQFYHEDALSSEELLGYIQDRLNTLRGGGK